MSKEKFKLTLMSAIDTKFLELMLSKPEKERTLNYIDALCITTLIRKFFNKQINQLPPVVEAALQFSEATIAPSARERLKHLKMAIGAGIGTAGIVMLLTGILSLLGVGSGAIAVITAAIMGSSVFGPIAWSVMGVVVATLGGYFAFTGSPAEVADRFLKVLKTSLSDAVDEIWFEFGEKLSSIEETNK